jgi:hypothetical protein
LRVSVTFYYLAKKNADILFYNLSAKSKGALSSPRNANPQRNEIKKAHKSESISSYVVFLEPQFSKIDANNLIKSDFETLPHHIPALRISIEIPSANIIMVE